MGNLILISAIGILFFFVVKNFFNKEKTEKVTKKTLSNDEKIRLIGLTNSRPIVELSVFYMLFLEMAIIGVSIFFIFSMMNITPSSENLLMLLVIILFACFQSYTSRSVVIPANCRGILTVLGERQRILVVEGNYRAWLLDNIFIGISNAPIKTSKESKETYENMKNGLPYIGDAPYEVWNSLEENDKGKKEHQISCMGANNTPILTKVTVGLRIVDSLRIAFNNDVFGTFFYSARECLKDVFSKFNDVDANFLKTSLKDLMLGKTVVTAVVSQKNITGTAVNDIVRNKDGSLAIVTVKDGEDVDIVIKYFKISLKQNADKEYLDAATNNGEVNIKVIKLDKNLMEIAEKIGLHLFEINFTDMKLSDERMQAVIQVAQEDQQKQFETRTADSIVTNAKRLAEGMPDADPNIIAAIAANNSGIEGVRVVYTGSRDGKKGINISSDITTGIVAGNEASKP